MSDARVIACNAAEVREVARAVTLIQIVLPDRSRNAIFTRAPLDRCKTVTLGELERLAA